MLTTVLLGLLAIALPIGPSTAQVQSSTQFTLVLVCDTYQMGENRDGRGGIPRISAALKAERARNVPVFVAHAGDAISPSLMSSLDHGAHMIDLLNMLDLDMFVPGNHEFDFGPDVFVERMAQAEFPIYAANLKGPGGSTLPGIRSHTMISVGGVRIGIAGLTADDSPRRSSPGNLVFEDTVDTAGRLTAALRKAGADLVVLVVHAARAIDELLQAESGADVILSGDDHDLRIGFDGRTAFAEAMQDGLYLIAVDLDIRVSTTGDRRRVAWWPNFRVIDTGALSPDGEVAQRVALYEATLAKEFDVRIGITSTELDSRTAAVRGGEAAIGNLIADAIKARTGADIALVNGGGVRGNRVYPPGSPITRRDVLSELPFGNQALVLDIAGSDLRQALEEGFAGAERLTGAFPQVAGLRIRADLSRPVGERIVSVLVNDEPLDEVARYKLATSEFLARGGDGYEALKSARVVVGPTDADLVASHVIAYIGERRMVSPVIEGRVVVARARPAE